MREKRRRGNLFNLSFLYFLYLKANDFLLGPSIKSATTKDQFSLIFYPKKSAMNQYKRATNLMQSCWFQESYNKLITMAKAILNLVLKYLIEFF